MMTNSPNPTPESAAAPAGVPRRAFLRYTGASVAITGLLLAGCDDDSDDVDANLVDVGADDTGILNYAYALEQLEAAFYAEIKNGAYYKGLGANSAEKQILDDLALHELAHKNFFKAALGNNAIKDLEPDFSAVNFGDKNSVLTNAQAFEDLGVAAYNGAGRFIKSPTNLALAGKIVSVEARHAALIRDLRQYNNFVGSDVVDLFIPTAGSESTPGAGTGTGKERSKRPQEVLNTANQFLKAGSKLSARSFS
ncbi:ferritin-like domain-containing protein [Hymenobacter sediminis]|uniref:ferritin-like domain-containing protein n=1 Tax=Hymenobacter sediminis TaxID=2218621 RepID=UPI001EE3BEAA|nr:ferritin-like domain-containing protein [Hymenobacter sediminis]